MVRFGFFYSFIILIFLSVFCGCSNKNSDNKSENGSENKIKNTSEHFSSFLFVGIIGKNPGLYKFDINKRHTSRIWFNSKEKVIELSYSENKKFAFFLTAETVGRLGVFPYLTNVRLYLIDTFSSDVYFIKNLGSGLQLFTSWESKTAFKIIFNCPDKKIVTYIDQKIEFYNVYGKELSSQVKIFDLTKDGYPKPALKNNQYYSSGKDYKIYYSDTSKIISIGQNSHPEKNLIINSDQKLGYAEYSDDSKYLIFSTKSLSPADSGLSNGNTEESSIYIYSTKENKIVKNWIGEGIKDFLIVNDYLIFDEGFQKDSEIKIIKINTQKDFFTIKFTGGCGLRNIPQIPYNKN